MKKRLEKKVEKIRRKKVHEILEMVLEINGTYSRQRALTGNKPTAFFYFSGHTAGVAVNVYNDGWSSGNSSDHAMGAYIDAHIKGAELTDLKNEIKNVMEELRYAGEM